MVLRSIHRGHVKNVNSPADRVKELVNKLNRKWFMEMRSRFDKLREEGEDYYLHSPHPDDYDQPVYWDSFWYSQAFTTGIETGEGIIKKILVVANEVLTSVVAAKKYYEAKVHILEIKSWIADQVGVLLRRYNDPAYEEVMSSFIGESSDDLDKVLMSVQERIDNRQDAKKLPAKVEGLDGVILESAIQEFVEIEQQLYEQGYIDSGYRWLKKADDCAGFLNRIILRGYCRKVRPGMELWITKTLKPFFENRYDIIFTKQMQQTYRKGKKLRNHFLWIEQYVKPPIE